ncbi:thiol:disulfide interchange protein DsbA/DsbL [Burkholderiaceae bacterium DAT-1]|nr:thiol:disulfide interchange protein DsbA/DsbL [Burkholderiaceae bacterium DAT-1]
MIRGAKHVLFTLMLLLGLNAHAALKVGVDYDVLPRPITSESPGKIEVVELFWYMCGHCYNTQQPLNKWRASQPKDVAFRPMHVMYGGRSDLEGHARLYLALKGMGKLDQMQDRVFAAINEQHVELRREEVLVKWLVDQGIPVDQFMNYYKGFSVGAQLSELQHICMDNNIGKTPTFVVAGKYRLIPGEAQSHEEMFAKLSELVAFARQAESHKK